MQVSRMDFFGEDNETWGNWTFVSDGHGHDQETGLAPHLGLALKVRDSNGISKLPLIIQLILPYKVGCIRGSLEIPLLPLLKVSYGIVCGLGLVINLMLLAVIFGEEEDCTVDSVFL